MTSQPTSPRVPTSPSDMLRSAPMTSEERTARYRLVRERTANLVAHLSAEDHVIQSMPDASPAKWHLAHTTWFFETFLLEPNAPGYRPFDTRYKTLFNSYYNGVGAQFSRVHRGTLSRPTVQTVHAYRAHVDQAMQQFITPQDDLADLIVLGLHHEEQHQELILTDIKHGLGMNPLRPAYRDMPAEPSEAPSGEVIEFSGGISEVGRAVDAEGFAFDNETPRAAVLLQPFALACDVVTNAEWRGFREDNGYQRPELWLSDGWAWRCALGLERPLYETNDERLYTLGGEQPIDDHAPVTHISFFEADAFARWSGKRLPTEFEWEHACLHTTHSASDFQEDAALHPVARGGEGLRGMLGGVWEWTSSSYVAYPRYQPLPGTVGEYNGKFMNGQRVLRGGSIATPRDHIRPTYRNFFPPDKQWQFTGLRLAEDR